MPGSDAPRGGRLRRLARPWIVMPLVGLLAFGGWFVLRSDGDSNATAESPETVLDVTTGTMALTASAEGTLESARTDDLSFTSAGTVTSVNVEAGDKVHAGDVLATLDSAALDLAVADAESSLADAQSALSDDQDAGASDAQIAADESSVVAAQNSVDSARDDLAGKQLVATFDGTVASVHLTFGDELAEDGSGGTSPTGSASGSGDSSSTLGASDTSVGADPTAAAADPQIEVVDTDHFTVDLGFDSTDIEHLEVGQPASMTVAASSGGNGIPGGFAALGGAFPGGFSGPAQGQTPTQNTSDTTAPADDASVTTDQQASGPSGSGVVWSVGEVADASSGVASYPVTVLFEDDSGDFNAGANVSVEITYAERDDVVQVASLAITTTDGTSTVTVRNADGSDETRTVTTGLTSATMTEIKSGLEAGDQVVLSFPGAGGRGPGGGGDAPTFGFPGGATGGPGGGTGG